MSTHEEVRERTNVPKNEYEDEERENQEEEGRKKKEDEEGMEVGTNLATEDRRKSGTEDEEDSSLLRVGPPWFLAESTPGLVVYEVRKEVPAARSDSEDVGRFQDGDGQGDEGFCGRLRGGVTENFLTGSEVRKGCGKVRKILGDEEKDEKPAKNEAKEGRRNCPRRMR
jgi:hypothetical protein